MEMTRVNPYSKFLSAEDNLHIAVVNYLRYQYPKLFWMHPVNEGKRTKFEQYKAKELGITSGIPDILIFEQSIAFNGLAIELKIKPNKPTDNQIMCMKKLKDSGWWCAVSYTFDEAKKEIDNYLM